MTKLHAQTSSRGPLHGLRIIEFAGIGPAPLAGMLLADMGADVIVIDSAAEVAPAERHRRVAMHRGKRSMALDLKCEAGREVAWKLLKSADALIEGFTLGVMDQLGFGADAVAARHPRLVYGRVTGRPAEAPVIASAIEGEMAGGALSLAFGMVCALHEAKISGRGQVVEAAMIDAVAAMNPLIEPMRIDGLPRTPARQPTPVAWCGEHTDEILAELASGAHPVSAESQRSQDSPALASGYATGNYL